ncbi:PREDICTED: piezo-type mechanosensitive ion channel component 1-like [Condylura cristata]|uniref:piezo-type mechanosensitive ion channel component 1-like n=1 Tax=Condylura cristata TaxID=143302 RepID=UPI00064306D0|nr:PREDICTED: piezo-type mechanosensitive ion channel component 1-like [Condylura cristata]
MAQFSWVLGKVLMDDITEALGSMCRDSGMVAAALREERFAWWRAVSKGKAGSAARSLGGDHTPPREAPQAAPAGEEEGLARGPGGARPPGSQESLQEDAPGNSVILRTLAQTSLSSRPRGRRQPARPTQLGLATIVVKYFSQFGFLPWTTRRYAGISRDKPFSPPNILGVEKKDSYVLCDLLQLLLLFFHRSAMKKSSGADLAESLSEDKVPEAFLSMVLLQFGTMIVDRALYLRKTLFGKCVFQVVLVVGVHFWLFFILPGITERFRFVPFLLELRAVIGWVWTDTALSLSSWICLEDIYANIFIMKCWQESEKTLFTMSSQDQNLAPFSDADYDQLTQRYALHPSAMQFLADYRPEDIVLIKIKSHASLLWGISPANRAAMIKELANASAIHITTSWTIQR